jgi:23S rRNA (uracil1939-C5)-methyltransferase
MIPNGCVSACPGCKHRAMTAEESFEQKQTWVVANVQALVPTIQRIISPQQRWGYRRKATLHARHENGEWKFGLLLRRRFEEHFIPIPKCPVQATELNRLFHACRNLPNSWPLAFVQISGSAVTLVLKSPRLESLVAEAVEKIAPLLGAGAEAVFINWNAAAGRRVLSSRHMEQIYGPKFLRDGGFLHGPVSFRQQIAELENHAQAMAAKYLQDCPSIVDLYCGLGISLARWRQAGKDALGVELVGEACELAELNAPGAKILKGKVEDRLPQLRKISGHFGIYTNPPRNGHGSKVNAWLNDSGAERIAYLSCNMRSLNEDLSALTNYRAELLQPFDFFPQTDHVEALVLLARGK